MTSPFQFIMNTRIRTVAATGVSIVNGRAVETPGDTLLFEAWTKRMQYSGVSSGSERVPLFSQLGGRMLPGGDGDKFYYRGYVLRKAVISNEFDWEDWAVDTSGLTWEAVLTNPLELKPQREVSIKVGNDDTTFGQIQRSSGVFGGTGIDEILYREIQGVEIQFTAGELL